MTQNFCFKYQIGISAGKIVNFLLDTLIRQKCQEKCQKQLRFLSRCKTPENLVLQVYGRTFIWKYTCGCCTLNGKNAYCWKKIRSTTRMPFLGLFAETNQKITKNYLNITTVIDFLRNNLQCITNITQRTLNNRTFDFTPPFFWLNYVRHPIQ